MITIYTRMLNTQIRMIARVCRNSFQFPIHSILLRISCTRSLLAVIIYRASLSSAKYIFGQRLLRGRGPSVVVISAGIAWHPFELVLPRLSFGTAISQIELADERPVSLDSPRGNGTEKSYRDGEN